MADQKIRLPQIDTERSLVSWRFAYGDTGESGETYDVEVASSIIIADSLKR